VQYVRGIGVKGMGADTNPSGGANPWAFYLACYFGARHITLGLEVYKSDPHDGAHTQVELDNEG